MYRTSPYIPNEVWGESNCHFLQIFSFNVSGLHPNQFAILMVYITVILYCIIALSPFLNFVQYYAVVHALCQGLKPFSSNYQNSIVFMQIAMCCARASVCCLIIIKLFSVDTLEPCYKGTSFQPLIILTMKQNT